MPDVILVPNGTVSNNWTLVGGATAHAVTADSNDSTYLSSTGTSFVADMQLQDLSIPAGARIAAVRIRLRVSHMGTTGKITTYLYNGPVGGISSPVETIVGQDSIATVALPWRSTYNVSAEWDVPTFNSIRLLIINTGPARVIAARVDVRYSEQPVVNPSVVEAVSGVVSSVTRPTVITNYSDPEGDSLREVEFTVLRRTPGGWFVYAWGSQANSVFSIPTTDPNYTFQIPHNLDNGIYNVSVRARQAWSLSPFWSNVVNVQWEQDVVLTNNPEIDATYESGPNRVKLLPTKGSGPSGTAATLFSIFRHDVKGVMPVHGAILIPASANALTDDQASFENANPDFWVHDNCTLANSSAFATHGTKSLEITSTGGSVSMNMNHPVPGVDFGSSVPVVSTVPYRLTFDVRHGSTSALLFPSVAWFNSKGNWISTWFGPSEATTNSFVTRSYILTPPANASWASVGFHMPSTSSGNKFYVDRLGLMYNAVDWALPSTTAPVVYDYEAPKNQNTLYIVEGLRTVDGRLLGCAEHGTDTVSVIFTDWWLKDPGNPDNNMILDVATIPVRIGSREDQAEFNPLSRQGPVIVSGAIRRAEFPLSVEFVSEDDLEKFIALRWLQKTLLLQQPMRRHVQWYFRFGPAWTEIIENASPTYVTVEFEVKEVATPGMDGH